MKKKEIKNGQDQDIATRVILAFILGMVKILRVLQKIFTAKTKMETSIIKDTALKQQTGMAAETEAVLNWEEEQIGTAELLRS